MIAISTANFLTEKDLILYKQCNVSESFQSKASRRKHFQLRDKDEYIEFHNMMFTLSANMVGLWGIEFLDSETADWILKRATIDAIVWFTSHDDFESFDQLVTEYVLGHNQT
jgi:hypothetical protein